MTTVAVARVVFTPIDATEEVIYSVPTGETLIITQIVLCNTHSAGVTVNLSITNSAATSTTAANRIFNSMSLASNETMMIASDMYLDTGDKLWASASSDDVVNILITGVKTIEES
jgi:hypothetical protein